jgi:4'-phosphopantetheinyl transferase EntD
MVVAMSAFVEVFGDPAMSSPYAAEARAVARAVPERRRAHATVRACARAALLRLGQPPEPILDDADGVPIWPAGVVGSLTHCRGYAAALVSLRTDHSGVGLDTEPHQPLPAGVADVVLREDDTHDLATGWHADRIAFCAKEAAYKTWFPPTRRWLEFIDVATNVSADGTFTARADGLPVLRGRWMVRRGYVVAATGMGPC